MALAPLSLHTTSGLGGSRPCARTSLDGADDPRRAHGEQQEERDEHENGGPDERRSVAVEVTDEDPRDHRADRLSEGPYPGAEAGHFGSALGNNEVDEEGNIERGPDTVREAYECHDDQGLRDGLHLRADKRDERERNHAHREHGFLSDAVGKVARGDRTYDRPQERGEKELEGVAFGRAELVHREPSEVGNDPTGAEPEDRRREDVLRQLALREQAADIFADVDLHAIFRRRGRLGLADADGGDGEADHEDRGNQDEDELR